MNDEKSILEELRRIAAWADLQRKMTKWTLIAVPIFILIVIVAGVVIENRIKTNLDSIETTGKADPPDWSDVDWNIRLAKLEEAISIGEELIQKTPQYPDGHKRLASAYLAAGKVAQAREHFAQAFRLLPSEENEKLMLAIDKRVTNEAISLPR